MSTFKLVNTHKGGDLAEPVLVSFPQNAPNQAQLNEMEFNLFEQPSSKKRVLKSQFKAMKYQSENTQTDVK
jgi:hypothetical protein